MDKNVKLLRYIFTKNYNCDKIITIKDIMIHTFWGALKVIHFLCFYKK